MIDFLPPVTGFLFILSIFLFHFALILLGHDDGGLQKSSDTVYISGLGTDSTEKELTDNLEKLFASIGRIKIDKRTGTSKSMTPPSPNSLAAEKEKEMEIKSPFFCVLETNNGPIGYSLL